MKTASQTQTSLSYLLLLLLPSVLVILASTGVAAEEEAAKNAVCRDRLVFVTGGTGRVGTLATKMLLKQGFCVRILTRRDITSARIKFDVDDDNDNNPIGIDRLEFVQGTLGDGSSVTKAFQPRESSGYASVSHVLFAAGGEQADYEAVNNLGVAECAAAAVSVGVSSMVVLSTAWASMPYSFASVLFNSLYDALPMAKHLVGENALRTVGNSKDEGSPFNYVIIRAGRLVPDDEYPPDAPDGLLYAQGDLFDFLGQAGQPGMCLSQLAHAVVAALGVQGKYTVELTSGTTDYDDVSIYTTLLQDGVASNNNNNNGYLHNHVVSDKDVERFHVQALSEFLMLMLALLVACIGSCWILGWKKALIFSLLLYVLAFYGWYKFLSGRSVLDCLKAEGRQGNPEEL